MTTIRINIHGEDKVFYPYIDNDELVIYNNVVVDQISEEDIAEFNGMTSFGSLQEAITKTFDIEGTFRGEECIFNRCWVREAGPQGVRILFGSVKVKPKPEPRDIMIETVNRYSEQVNQELGSVARFAEYVAENLEGVIRFLEKHHGYRHKEPPIHKTK